MINVLQELGRSMQYNAGPANRSVTALSATVGVPLPAEGLFFTITSASANYAIVLPSPAPGRWLMGYIGANGCEMWASGSSVSINNVTCSDTNEAAIPANSMFEAQCVSATNWILWTRTYAGAAAEVTPDAR